MLCMGYAKSSLSLGVTLWSSDLHQEANEQTLAAIAASYTDYLHQCKASGLHWVHPGRFVLPGLEGAPVLQFSFVIRRRAQ